MLDQLARASEEEARRSVNARTRQADLVYSRWFSQLAVSQRILTKGLVEPVHAWSNGAKIQGGGQAEAPSYPQAAGHSNFTGEITTDQSI